MTTENTSRIQPSTFTLALGVLLTLFGLFAVVTAGNPVYITAGIFIFGMGFVGYIFKNDVFDITIGVVTALGVMFFGLYEFQTHFMAHETTHHAEGAAPEHSSEHAEESKTE